MKTETITESLPCHLTDEERLHKADELAAAVRSVESRMDEKRYLNQQLTSKVREAEARRENLATVVASGTEYREVTVKRQYDYDKGVVREIRTDTGELISERGLTDDERQTEISVEEPVVAPSLDGTPLGFEEPEADKPKSSSIFPLRNRAQRKKKAAGNDELINA